MLVDVKDSLTIAKGKVVNTSDGLYIKDEDILPKSRELNERLENVAKNYASRLTYFLGISGDPTELDNQFRVRDIVHEREHYIQEQMFKIASVKRRLDVEFLPLGDNGT